MRESARAYLHEPSHHWQSASAVMKNSLKLDDRPSCGHRAYDPLAYDSLPVIDSGSKEKERNDISSREKLTIPFGKGGWCEYRLWWDGAIGDLSAVNNLKMRVTGK